MKSGTIDGKTATILAIGKDQNGKVTTGTITMIQEDNQWKMKEDAWVTQMN